MGYKKYSDKYLREDGKETFVGNEVVKRMVDQSLEGKPCDLNTLWSMALGRQKGPKITRKQMKEFYKMMGYTVGGLESIKRGGNFNSLPTK